MKTFNDVSVSDLLLRASAFRAIAQAFAYPSNEQVAFSAAALAEVAKRSSELGNPQLERCARTAAKSWQKQDPEFLRDEYQRMFLGSAPVSMHETAYGDGRRIAGRPAELADISGFYLAFGFNMTDADPDLPDHLCAELEFYSGLLVKLAYAGRSGWSPARVLVRRALRVFLGYHMGRWIGAFHSALNEHRATSSYLQLAATLELLTASEARLFRVRPQLATGRLPPDVMQEDTLECPRSAVTSDEEMLESTLSRT